MDPRVAFTRWLRIHCVVVGQHLRTSDLWPERLLEEMAAVAYAAHSCPNHVPMTRLGGGNS